MVGASPCASLSREVYRIAGGEGAGKFAFSSELLAFSSEPLPCSPGRTGDASVGWEVKLSARHLRTLRQESKEIESGGGNPAGPKTAGALQQSGLRKHSFVVAIRPPLAQPGSSPGGPVPLTSTPTRSRRARDPAETAFLSRQSVVTLQHCNPPEPAEGAGRVQTRYWLRGGDLQQGPTLSGWRLCPSRNNTQDQHRRALLYYTGSDDVPTGSISCMGTPRTLAPPVRQSSRWNAV